MKLILASQSPRRRELLAQVGYRFDVHAADIDESRHANEAPEAYVQRLALEKAQVVLSKFPDAVILGADTTVVLDGNILNKPRDIADAEAMLRALSGRTHLVHTGIAVVCATQQRSHVETTAVTFATIDDAGLDRYLATGDSLDKAGAYGVQGFAAQWVPRIEGCYFNVMGLPLAAMVALLASFDI